MAAKKKLGRITRKPKMFYYVDGEGRVYERNMKTGSKTQVEHVNRPLKSLVYIDKAGNIMSTPMHHGEKRKSKGPRPGSASYVDSYAKALRKSGLYR
jgi:hypothetical protein